MLSLGMEAYHRWRVAGLLVLIGEQPVQVVRVVHELVDHVAGEPLALERAVPVVLDRIVRAAW